MRGRDVALQTSPVPTPTRKSLGRPRLGVTWPSQPLGLDMVPHRRGDRPRMGCCCDSGDSWTNRRDSKRNLLHRPQAVHDDSAPRRRHGRQPLPLPGFPPADLAEQIATDSLTSSSLEHCRLDLSSNLLQQRLHHHPPRWQRVELDLPRQLLDRHLDQRPRRLCSHHRSGSDLPGRSALSRWTDWMARALAKEADRKTRPLFD